MRARQGSRLLPRQVMERAPRASVAVPGGRKCDGGNGGGRPSTPTTSTTEISFSDLVRITRSAPHGGNDCHGSGRPFATPSWTAAICAFETFDAAFSSNM